LCVLLVTSCLIACNQSHSTAVEDPAYKSEITKWQQQRFTNLKKEDGWLTLIGLFWLKKGENKFGSDPSNDVVIASNQVPKFAGSIFLDDAARLEVRPGINITNEGKPVTSLLLKSDEDGEPTVLTMGTVSFHLIKRGDRIGIRARDKENPARKNLAPLNYFAITPDWRVNARFEKYEPIKQIKIINILGMAEDTPSPGAVVFDHDGKSYRLDALQEKGSDELFIIFADQTTGKETYGAGRYMYTALPDKDNKVLVDFNKAYSPPCAFTSFATCPLPPPQNRLNTRVEAGEKKPPAIH